MVKLTDIIKMLPANSPEDSDTEKILKEFEGVDDIADIANAIGIEVHVIKHRRGRPKATEETEPKQPKEKKPVGRPKKEEKAKEPRVLKNRGRKPLPKPTVQPEPKVKKQRGRKPKPKTEPVMTDADRQKRKEKFLRQITALANIIENFDNDLISKII